MDRLRRYWFPLVLALVLLAPATSLLAVPTAQAQTGGKVLRVRQPFYPDVLDPQKLSFIQEADVMALAFEGLTRLDKDLHTVPAAAESWEFSPDGKTLTFHLREGLTYSDG